jgi:hypothetical protein
VGPPEELVTDPVTITLSPADAALAVKVGEMRLRSSGNTGRNPHRSQAGRSLDQRLRHEVLGCYAEAAVAQHLGIPYDGSVNRFHGKPDVGPFEVRATDRRDGCLIIRDNDHPNRPYVLAVGDPLAVPAVIELRGWLWGHEARRSEWLRDPHDRRPCWMVPQQHLHPIPAHG